MSTAATVALGVSALGLLLVVAKFFCERFIGYGRNASLIRDSEEFIARVDALLNGDEESTLVSRNAARGYQNRRNRYTREFKLLCHWRLALFRPFLIDPRLNRLRDNLESLVNELERVDHPCMSLSLHAGERSRASENHSLFSRSTSQAQHVQNSAAHSSTQDDDPVASENHSLLSRSTSQAQHDQNSVAHPSTQDNDPVASENHSLRSRSTSQAQQDQNSVAHPSTQDDDAVASENHSLLSRSTSQAQHVYNSVADPSTQVDNAVASENHSLLSRSISQVQEQLDDRETADQHSSLFSAFNADQFRSWLSGTSLVWNTVMNSPPTVQEIALYNDAQKQGTLVPRPFKCTEGCWKEFTRSSDLNQHVRIVHRQERPHKCEFCTRVFVKRFDLKSHIAAVHMQEKPHECKKCGKAFAKRSNLSRHISKLHPDYFS